MNFRKWMALALSAVLMITAFTGCGTKSGLSRTNEDACLAAIQAADDYLDGSIDANTAWAIIQESKAAITQEDGKMKATILQSYITNIGTALLMATQTEGQSYSGGSLVVRRNELARELGVSER